MPATSAPVALLCAAQAQQALPLLQRLAARTKDVRFEAQLRELIAVALAALGKREEAISAFKEVVRELPAHLPGAGSGGAAARRWAATCRPGSSRRAPGATPPPLELKLPAEVALLHRMGLDRDAATVLFEPRETAVAQSCAALGRSAVRAVRAARGRRPALRSRARCRDSRRPDRAPGPRSRWMWDCVYPRPYADLVTSAERERLLAARRAVGGHASRERLPARGALARRRGRSAAAHADHRRKGRGGAGREDRAGGADPRSRQRPPRLGIPAQAARQLSGQLAVGARGLQRRAPRRQSLAAQAAKRCRSTCSSRASRTKRRAATSRACSPTPPATPTWKAAKAPSRLRPLELPRGVKLPDDSY